MNLRSIKCVIGEQLLFETFVWNQPVLTLLSSFVHNTYKNNDLNWGNGVECFNNNNNLKIFRPSDRVRKKWKIMQKFLAILHGRKWRIYRKDARLWGNCKICWFANKIHVNVLQRILALYDMFDLSLSFVDRYFFVQHSFSIVFIVEFLTKA